MTPKTLSVELKAAMKQLRLGRLIPTLADRIALAEKDDLPIEDFLLMVFIDEVNRRQSESASRRADNAGLDPDMTFERWDKTAKVKYDKRVLSQLASLRFVDDAQNTIILGPVGVGKTFFAHALGHVACRAGYSVGCYRADALLRILKSSRLDNSRDALLVGLTTLDLLILDDFVLEPMSREESRDMYQLFIERTGKTSTIITSNRDTSDWLAFFDENILAQSAVDRFRNNAYDLVIDGESYRPRLKPNIDRDGPPPAAPVTKQLTRRRAPKRSRH
jgi:DNA replication protein DnaC